jgi:hypothetical protein
VTAPDLRAAEGRAAWTRQTGVAPLCGLIYSDTRAIGCRRPYGHDGNCDATFVRGPASTEELDDESDGALEAGIARDDELRREERT